MSSYSDFDDDEEEEDTTLTWPEQVSLESSTLTSSADNESSNQGNDEQDALSCPRQATTSESLFSRPKIIPRSTEDFPLLNPNKLDPSLSSKDLPPPPIISPSCKPRFPKDDAREAKAQPSVTKVLEETMPIGARDTLDRWMGSMIRRLGLEGFMKYRREIFARAHGFHALLANYLLGPGEEPTFNDLDPAHQVLRNLWRSIHRVVMDNINNVRLVEHTVTHHEMNYRGIVDCVAFYGDELVVIDFKTAEKPKRTIESLYDNPLQVTAYCGAINNDSSISNDLIDRNICSGVIIVAYVDGSEATTHHFGIEQLENNYWKEWTRRLDQYFRMDAAHKEQQEVINHQTEAN